MLSSPRRTKLIADTGSWCIKMRYPSGRGAVMYVMYEHRGTCNCIFISFSYIVDFSSLGCHSNTADSIPSSHCPNLTQHDDNSRPPFQPSLCSTFLNPTGRMPGAIFLLQQTGCTWWLRAVVGYLSAHHDPVHRNDKADNLSNRHLRYVPTRRDGSSVIAVYHHLGSILGRPGALTQHITVHYMSPSGTSVGMMFDRRDRILYSAVRRWETNLCYQRLVFRC